MGAPCAIGHRPLGDARAGAPAGQGRRYRCRRTPRGGGAEPAAHLRLRHRADRRLRSQDGVRRARLPAPLPARAGRRAHRPVGRHHAGTAVRVAARGDSGRMSVDEKIGAAPVRAADRLDTRAVLVVTACCACWGVNQVAIKIANAGISPILQVGLRSLLAGVLVLFWAKARGVRLFERDRTLWPGIAAGLLFGTEFVALYFGLTLTTASRGVVLLYLAPFVV